MSDRGDSSSTHNRGTRSSASTIQGCINRLRNQSVLPLPSLISRRQNLGECDCSTCNTNGNNEEDEPCDPDDGSYYSCIGILIFFVVVILADDTCSYRLGLCFRGSSFQKPTEANLALASMGALISTPCAGMTCSTNQKVDDPNVIISGEPVLPGKAFCYRGDGEFTIVLSAQAYLTGFSYEHVTKEAHPEKHIHSAPKLMLISAIAWDSRGEEVETFLGNYEFLDNGKALQTFYFQNPCLKKKFPAVKISIPGNHGHHFTCIYRIQIHGKLRQDDTHSVGKSCGV